MTIYKRVSAKPRTKGKHKKTICTIKNYFKSNKTPNNKALN